MGPASFVAGNGSCLFHNASVPSLAAPTAPASRPGLEARPVSYLHAVGAGNSALENRPARGSGAAGSEGLTGWCAALQGQLTAGIENGPRPCGTPSSSRVSLADGGVSAP